ncbi:MAG: hypothetical protein JWN54_3263 [Mycobacterium sp.]|jgi:hypothetical protein|nr:hypothetical protein [Mycobacterium sp.]
MVRGMAKRKVTYSLDPHTVRLAEKAAARAGLSTSAWLDRVARREAVRAGAGSRRTVLSDARLDERELAAGEADLHATG